MMFLLKTIVMVLTFNSPNPTPYAEAVTLSFATRAECELMAEYYGDRAAEAVARELRLTRAAAVVVGTENKCEPIGVEAMLPEGE